MLVPFSKKAKGWEAQALKLRLLGRVGKSDLLDPWILASEVGLRICDAMLLLDCLSMDERKAILHEQGKKWSGGVFPKILPDGTRICILNPTHSRRRNKITLMEEISHVFLGHKPCAVTVTGDGVEVRDYNRTQEQEAYGVGAAALLPWLTFFHAINSGKTIDELSEIYDVTRDLVKYRIQITGGHRLYRARQQCRV